MTEDCAHCRFWKATDEFDELGRCRKSPPTLMVAFPDLLPDEDRIVAIRESSVFPITGDSDWCGKYREAEWSLQQTSYLRQLDSDVERLRHLAGRLASKTPANASDPTNSEHRAMIKRSAYSEVAQLRGFGEDLVKRRGPDGPSEIYERARDPENDILQAPVLVAWVGLDGFGQALDVDDDVAF